MRKQERRYGRMMAPRLRPQHAGGRLFFTLREGRFMTRNEGVGRFIAAIALALALFAWPFVSASAQTSTGAVRGTVTGQGGAPLADVQIGARNVESGIPRGTTSRDDGTYFLGGVVP